MPGQPAQGVRARGIISTTINLSSPAVQRQVQNGPSSDDVEVQRRQMMEQQQLQAQVERDRRASTSVATLQIKLSPSPSQCHSPPPEYSHCRTGAPPPSYAKVTSRSSSRDQDSDICCSTFQPAAQSSDPPHSSAPAASQLSTSLASAFSPVQPGVGTLSRNVRQVPVSPLLGASHAPLLPTKPGAWSSLPPSPPVVMVLPPMKPAGPQPVLPVALPLIPLQNGRVTGPSEQPGPNCVPLNGHLEDHFLNQLCSSSRHLFKSTDGSFETGPLSTHAAPHLSQFPSFLYQPGPPFTSLPPSYTTVSEGALTKKTPPPPPLTAAASHSSPPLPLGHPAAAPLALAPPPPPPPPGPPPPPPLPAGGGPVAGGDDSPGAGLAAALAGARLRRVQRSEDGSGGSSSKNEANRTSGGGGLMQEMNALLARRRKAATQTDKPSEKKEEESQSEDPSPSPSPITRGPGQQNSTDPLKKPWDRASSADRSSLVSRVKPVSSSNDMATDALDFDRMKQEILEEVVRELHKVKDEIIDAIRQELSRISTT